MNSSPQAQPEPFFGRFLALRHFLTRRSTAGLLIGVAVVAATYIWTQRTPANTSTMMPTTSAGPLQVETAVVTIADEFDQSRTFTGVIRAARRSQLSFERTDRIDSVLVDQGDRVDADQALATLDTQSLLAQRNETEARLAEARAYLEELEAGPRKQTIAAQRAVVRDLKAEVERLSRKNMRRERLVKSRAASQEDLEEVAFGLASASAKLEAATSRLDELEEGTRAETLSAQRATVKQLEASLARIDVDISDSTLTAPYSGRITRRLSDEGTVVAAGEEILHLISDEAPEAWIGVPPRQARQLAEGQSLRVVVAGMEIDARVANVLSELDDATRTQTVILKLSEPELSVVPGEVARIRLTESTPAEGFWIPITSLTRGGRGLWSLHVVSSTGPQVIQTRTVEVIYSDGDRAFVRGTLHDGDRVVVRGTHRLVAGQPVTLSNAETAVR